MCSFLSQAETLKEARYFHDGIFSLEIEVVDRSFPYITTNKIRNNDFIYVFYAFRKHLAAIKNSKMDMYECLWLLKQTRASKRILEHWIDF